MLKHIKYFMASLTIALAFVSPQKVHAMEVECTQVENAKSYTGFEIPKELTLTEKKNAYKMMMFQQGQKVAYLQEELPRDVYFVIWGLLHELDQNPVLNGELIYPRSSDKKSFPFKIKELIKEGTLDLSDQKIFGNTANHLLMTTDLDNFFHVDKKCDKLVILIAPWFLINDQLETTAAAFKGIMAHWKKDLAPIGIFWRMNYWDNLNSYDYLTTKHIDIISKNSLYELWCNTQSHTKTDRWPTTQMIHVHTTPLKSFFFSFLNQNSA